VVEQPALAGQAAAVAGERAVGADHAVAGDDDADRVAAVGQAHGAGGCGTAELLGERAVRRGGAVGNCLQRLPHLLVEGRADRGEPQVERGASAGEVFAELRDRREQGAVVARACGDVVAAAPR